jgi:hypothetical protein
MTPLGLAVELAAAVPVGRDEARQAAERELSKGVYHENEPGPVVRAINAVLEWLGDLISRIGSGTPGGGPGLLLLALVLVGGIALVAWQVGPVRRGAGGGSGVVELSGVLDADEHRRRADSYADAGRYAEAVRERMRAIVRELESRGVLEPRPGRTADEVAREGAALVPAVAPDLRTAATVFDEVWFGGRAATPEADAALRQADQRVRRAQLVVVGSGAPAAGGYQVPW